MDKIEEIKKLEKVRDELYDQVIHIDLNDYTDVDLTEEEAEVIQRIEALTEIIIDLESEVPNDN